MLIYSLLLLMMITFRNLIQDGMKFYYQCQKIPSDDVLESLYKLRIRESAQLKTVLELCDMEIHQKDINAKLSKNEDNGEEEKRSETSNAKL